MPLGASVSVAGIEKEPVKVAHCLVGTCVLCGPDTRFGIASIEE